MSIESLLNRKAQLSKILDDAEASGNTFLFDSVFPEYNRICEQIRDDAMLNAPFTGCAYNVY